MNRVMDVFQAVRENPYPGRGIVLGLSEDGGHAAIAYFIMGRSENSRNRVFVEKDGGIVTEAFDPVKLVDPSLIIYTPVRLCAGGLTVVTNGDQTDTIAQRLAGGNLLKRRCAPAHSSRMRRTIRRGFPACLTYKMAVPAISSPF